MLIPLLTRLAVLGFGAIQALLTLRLVMSLADLPRAIMQFEPAVLALSEPLIDPFRRFEDMLHGMLGSRLPGRSRPGGRSGTDRLVAGGTGATGSLARPGARGRRP
jgi:hypothetical protein